MRQLLLDTHAALWALSAPDRLDPLVRDAIEDPRDVVAISAASVWEVEMVFDLYEVQVVSAT